MPDLLRVEDLSVAYTRGSLTIPVLNKINFAIKENEILAIVGESGSGKSTTAHALLKLPDAEYSGQVIWQGENLLQKSESELRNIRGKELSIIFQQAMSALNPIKKVGSHLTELLTHHLGLSKSKAKERAIGLLADVGLSDPEVIFDSYPFQLSGGMCQRAVIALALACGPKLLIADEPTTALDAKIQLQILDLLKSLRGKYKMSILFITHDLGIVAHLCDRVIVMLEGRIVEEGTSDDIFRNSRHLYTKALLNALPYNKHKSEHRLI